MATYHCAECESEEQRKFGVPHFLKSCHNGCGFVRYIRRDIQTL
jgi:hypothetical protein